MMDYVHSVERTVFRFAGLKTVNGGVKTGHGAEQKSATLARA